MVPELTSKEIAVNRVSGRIDDIEVLRAIAIIFTLLTHINGLYPWGASWIKVKLTYFNPATGVDLFFVVSGFVIARELLAQFASSATAETRGRIVAAFWVKRIFRIWPSSYLWIGALVLCSARWSDSGMFRSLPSEVGDFAAVVMQVANFHLWHCMLPNSNDCGDSVVYWSLSLEEQFYILLPLIILVSRKHLAKVLGGIVLSQLFLYRPPFNENILWWIRTDGLALGVLIAMLERTKWHAMLEPKFLGQRRYGIPLVLFVVFMLTQAEGTPFKIDPVFFSTGMAALIAALLVLVASYNRGYILSANMLKPVFLWIGSRSYAIYLIHAMAIRLTFIFWRHIEPAGTQFGANYTLRYTITWLLLIGMLAEANFRLVETPLRRKGRELADRINGRSAEKINEYETA